MHRDLPDGAPVSGVPYWYWLGGRPAMDFVNTRRERWRRDVDCLLSVDEVVTWLVRAGLLAQPMRAPASILGEARTLREAIDAGVRAAVERTAPDPMVVGLVDDWLALAGSRPALVARDRRRAGAHRARDGRLPAPRAGDGRLRRRAHARHPVRARPRAHLRLGHVLGTLLRPLAGRRPPLVLDGALRQPEQGTTLRRQEERMSGRLLKGDALRSTPRSPSPTARAARCATAGSTSRSSSARCRSSTSGACSSTGGSSPACRPPSRTRWPSAPADPRVDVQAALAMLGAGVGRLRPLIDISDEQARDDLARASVMALSFVAQSARGVGPPAGAAARGRPRDLDPRALPDPLARRGRPRPREGDRRLLDLGRRARHERARRSPRASSPRPAPTSRRRCRPRSARSPGRCTAARPRACCRCSTTSSGPATRTATSRTCSTAASG